VRIAKLQQILNRKYGTRKGEPKSNKWRKIRKKINREYSKRKRQRLYLFHCLSLYLVRNYDLICIEDLNIAGMLKNHCLASAISDAAWATFFNILQYKCDWYGKTLSRAGRFAATSKTCSVCGHKKDDLKLSDRTYACGNCGCTMDRDINAAINIKNIVMQETVRV
jgi:putative transposase